MHTDYHPLRTGDLSITKRIGMVLIFLIAFSIVYWLSKDGNPWAVDPADVSLPEPFEAVDAVAPVAALRDVPIAPDEERWDALREAWGAFAQLYIEDVLQLGPVDADTTFAALVRFAQHPDIAATFAAIDTTSGRATAAAAEQLERSFRRFHHHFPEEPVPTVVWMNSAFNYAVFPTPDHLAVGLDWFLGRDHPIVGRLAPEVFPGYLRDRMDPEFLAADALRGWLLVHFAERYHRTQTCADELLFWGKVLFVMDQLAPELNDRLWMDWSADQMAWAVENERAVWLELQPQSILFERDFGRYNRWFVEGPFTRAADIPQNSPDRLGAWMGYRIVADYMADHPELSLRDLLETKDVTPVLKAYRPDR